MVKIKVDLDNREKLKRLHTATHIINFSAREVLGSHIWQNGSNLKADIGSLDITHYDNLSLDEIFKIEKLANKVVFENKLVKVEELERGEAEAKYGFTLYQGGAIPMKVLRVVSVEENDIEACGGIHMESTGGIGLIKIVDSQKIQDGVVRLRFVVNDFALELVEKKQEIVDSVKEVFSVDEGSLVRTSEKFFNEWKEQKKEIDKLKDVVKSSYVKEIENSKDNVLSIEGSFDMGFLMEVFTFVSGFKKEINKGKFKIYVM
jgi:alanyl-tRNA synthetase